MFSGCGQLKQQGMHAGLPVWSEWGAAVCLWVCTTQRGRRTKQSAATCVYEAALLDQKGKEMEATRLPTQNALLQTR